MSQEIEIDHLELRENKVIMYYQIKDTLVDRYFTIRVYSSKDGYLNPLEKISGDIGLAIKPGPNKMIVWDAQQELGNDFDGKIAIEIRGRVYVPFINIDQIANYKVFKRKRKYPLTWSGGTPQNVMNFDLLKGDTKVTTFPNIANVGHHTFEFPAYAKPGGNYRFRVSDVKNKDEVVFSKPFKIKRKIPLLVKIVPIVAISSGILLLFDKKEDPIELPPSIENK